MAAWWRFARSGVLYVVTVIFIAIESEHVQVKFRQMAAMAPLYEIKLLNLV